MRAWVQTGFGGQEVRELQQVPAPRPAVDEVLVRVRACALNRLDVLQRRDGVVSTFRLPHIGGMDIIGEVVELGADVAAPRLGARVVIDPVVTCGDCAMCLAGKPMYCVVLRTIGSSRDGGFAELVAVPARNCIEVPADALSDVELASVPVASVTAWHGLLGAGRITPGETVVVPAAGSGVGAAGIQIAKRNGCRVITTVGTAAKTDAAVALGADLVIDRSAGAWWEAALEFTDGIGADLVFDHVGGPFLQQAIEATRIEGRVVMSGTTAGSHSDIRNTSVFHWGKTLIGHGGYTPEEMHQVVGAYLDGSLDAVVDSVWAFDELPAAEAKVERGDFSGKVILTMDAAA